MEAVLSSLGLGTRYCVVSADHEQPELYADDNERCPQTAFERFTDFGTVYDKFSSGERPSLTLAGRRSDSSAARQRQRSSEREKENTSPGQAVLTLFDRLAMRHSKTELSSFDRQFPLSRRSDKYAKSAAIMKYEDESRCTKGFLMGGTHTSNDDIHQNNGALNRQKKARTCGSMEYQFEPAV
ncbi:uncharacterized protein LOC119090336 [Pollicipes pollicipes]|uniref:uncharacterized protein LOC119090336 n=1 Tax=Pollicipes pollicipes TaxID=41117 RepID=UPI001884E77B|nr:uncharacterized protein LOC119090336 [Pollicipes pollicipes]